MENINDGTDMTDTDMNNEQVLRAKLETKQMDSRLVMFLVRSYLPVAMVEGNGFIRLLTELNADYVIPSRKAITKIILPEMFSKSLEEQKSIVQQESETICLTIDRWMSVKYEYPVIAITAHFITPDYKFKSVLLKCRYCERNSENLEFVLTETCMEWEISDKVNSCVTDDGADIVQAVNSLGWDHRSSMASKLNLALQNSLKLCDEALSKVKKTVCYFDSNCEAVQLLDECQTKEGIAEPMGLLDSEHTSWTTKYDMIERFLILQKPIEATIAEKLGDVDLPNITNMDWIKLRQLCKLLKPFKEATDALGGDKYTYASIVIPVVNGLKEVLQEIRKQPDYFCTFKELVECIENELNEQFNGVENEPNLALCTILDPRYKLAMFLDESAADRAKSNLVSEVEELMKGAKMEDGPNMANNTDETDFSLWRRKTMIIKKKQSYRSANAHQEVECYLQEDLTDRDPCKWWRSNESKYPHLANLFKTKCNKVSTSVPSEQLFTEQGIELRERRELLSLRKAEMIVFLRANLDEDDYFRLMPDIDDYLRTLNG